MVHLRNALVLPLVVAFSATTAACSSGTTVQSGGQIASAPAQQPDPRAPTGLGCAAISVYDFSVAPGTGKTSADEALVEDLQRSWPKLTAMTTSQAIAKSDVEQVVEFSSKNSKLAEVRLVRSNGLWNVTSKRICSDTEAAARGTDV